MFESLSTRLQEVFKSLRGEARLTEATVDAALREIRLALLEADVNFRVVKAFIERVRVEGGRRRGPEEPDAGPARRAHRPRRDARAVRRCEGRVAACRPRRRGSS